MKPVPDPADVRTVAVRLTNWVGDAVMNTPFLGEVRRLFPQARIIALGRRSVTPLFDPHPFVDEVWTIDDRTVGGRWDAARRLRRCAPDLGFALPNSMNAALLLRLGGVRTRVGYARDGRGLLLTHAIALRPQDLAVHEVRYYLRLLSLWGAPAAETPRLHLHVTEDEVAKMREWLAGKGLRGGQTVFGVNPAAFYGTAKRWLPERFAEVARRLAEEHDGQVFVTGIERERAVAQEVCDAGGNAFVNTAGEMSLRELMAFMRCCRLYLTNDSGAMHLAAALGTPLVAVFGSTDWVTTAPLSPSARIVREETECAPCLLRDCPIDHRCMTRVTSESVLAQARALMDETTDVAGRTL
ncbi:MAG: heptosyltransferase [Candidatus Sumerlaeota bacterium]|nr:heptosyltransferase [Candidatus Sumerlaeota bacterium]